MEKKETIYDVFVIGGGVNGCGIARDATGRGLNVCLAEMNDLGSGTSSTSTKLIHGGLRYLRYFDFRLVRESLKEREVLLKNMPHICWPMRFVLPAPKALLHKIVIRLGLFIYDNLGGRTILPGTKTIRVQDSNVGNILSNKFSSAFVFSDCWVEDARLVILNAVDAKKRGAHVLTHTKVTNLKREEKYWRVTTKGKDGITQEFFSYSIVNAAGPWVNTLNNNASKEDTSIHLVKGSHIVVKKMFGHGKAYFLLGKDKRIIFVIPFQEDFTLIGTTEIPHNDMSHEPNCSKEEKKYLIEFINSYFHSKLEFENIVWSYSGVRPLYKHLTDNQDSVSSITRDYMLNVESINNLPILTIYGGKLTTYRKLAENALFRMRSYFPKMQGSWTSQEPLPGGNFKLEKKAFLIKELCEKYSFLDEKWSTRLIKNYGTLCEGLLGDSNTKEDLGIDFGHSLTETEVKWLIENEFANCGEDILWRRTKLGLRFTEEQEKQLTDWVQNYLSV